MTPRRYFTIAILLAAVGLPWLTSTAYDEPAHRDIVIEALRLADLPFTPEDRADLIAGADHEDDDDCFTNMRYRHHGYNPVTGAAFDSPLANDELPARTRAERLWVKMMARWQTGERNGYVDEVDDPCHWHRGGYFHFLGRICHLLGDMASPGHAHAPDGHGGWETILGYDYEELWHEIDFPGDGVEGVLTPSSEIPRSPDWGSRMRPEDWTAMRNAIQALGAGDSLRGYIEVMALVTYHHTRFYGRIEADSPPLDESDEPLSRMFRQKMDYDSFFNAWLIDGIGWYEHELRSDSWWPELDKPRGGGKADTKVHDDKSATGFFYCFATHRQWDPKGPEGGAWPAKWPNGDGNGDAKTTLGEYYGEVLIPIAVRMTRGLLAAAWAAKDLAAGSLRSEWELTVPRLTGLTATLPASTGPCEVVADLDIAFDEKGRLVCNGTVTVDGGDPKEVDGKGRIRMKGDAWPYRLKVRGVDEPLVLVVSGTHPETDARISYVGLDCVTAGDGTVEFRALDRMPTAEIAVAPYEKTPNLKFRAVADITTEYGNDPVSSSRAKGRLKIDEEAETLVFRVRRGKQRVSFRGTRAAGAPDGTNFVGALKFRLLPAKGVIEGREVDAEDFLTGLDALDPR